MFLKLIGVLMICYFCVTTIEVLRQTAYVIDDTRNIIEYTLHGVKCRARVIGDLTGKGSINLFNYKASFLVYYILSGLLRYSLIGVTIYFSYAVFKATFAM